MLRNIQPENLFIFDIETVSAVPDFDSLSPEVQKLFEDKLGKLRKEDESPQDFYTARAGIYAEFGKIICISGAYITLKNEIPHLKIKTFFGHDEKQLLDEFMPTLLNVSKNNKILCGHNIREFDVPWLCRRLLINRMPLPPVLDIYGKKPWEVNHLDTLDLWKFGDYKHYTSLHLLSSILGIPTPKDDIDGSMVGRVYWQEGDLKRIAHYCSKDVVAVAQVILRLKNLPLVEEQHIQMAE